MTTLYSKYLWGKFWLLGCCIAFVACTDELSEETPTPADPLRVDVTLQFTVGAGASRAPEADASSGEYTLETTELENQMRTVTVIVESLGDDGKPLTPPQYDHQTIYLPAGVTTYETSMKLNTTVGKKHIYLGANMAPGHIEAFEAGRPYASVETTAEKVLSSVMTVNTDGSGQDILMFAQATQTVTDEATNTSTTSNVIELSASSIETPTLLDDVTLERVVSKVLLTCNTDDNTNVTVKDFLGYEDGGFCTLENIYYMLNMTNKKVYVQRTLDETGNYYIDPNYSIYGWVEYSATNKVFMLKDRDDYEQNFVHYDANSMMSITEDGFVPFASTGTMKQHPMRYEADKVGNSATPTNHYTEGIYCLENLVSVPSGFLSASGKSNNDVADLVSTYMLIAIRYIPKNIYVVEGEGYKVETFTDLNDVLARLPKTDDYPEGTYWMLNTDGTKGYFTYDAMQRAVKEGSDPDLFQPFIGGWSYYTTYIDGEVKDNSISYNDVSAWGLERNHYYILHVTEITAPGSSVMDNPMRINSVTIPWNDRGGTEVEIKPE